MEGQRGMAFGFYTAQIQMVWISMMAGDKSGLIFFRHSSFLIEGKSQKASIMKLTQSRIEPGWARLEAIAEFRNESMEEYNGNPHELKLKTLRNSSILAREFGYKNKLIFLYFCNYSSEWLSFMFICIYMYIKFCRDFENFTSANYAQEWPYWSFSERFSYSYENIIHSFLKYCCCPCNCISNYDYVDSE